MTSVKKKSEKPNSELTTMQIFSKAVTSGSEWCDKVNTTRDVHSSDISSPSLDE